MDKPRPAMRYPDGDEGEKERGRRDKIRRSVKDARAMLHAALSGLNEIERRLSRGLDAATCYEDTVQAWTEYEADIAHLIKVSMTINSAPWPTPNLRH